MSDEQPQDEQQEAPTKKKGRPKFANGRKAALQALDVLLAKHHNITKLSEDMQVKFDENPLKFYQEVAMPLTPKEFLVDTSGSPQDQAADVRDALKEIDESVERGGPIIPGQDFNEVQDEE